MGTPAENADTQSKQDEENQASEATFAARVNEITSKLEKDAKGNWVIPEDLTEEEKFAVNAERRYRDTQSAFTKTSQENKALKAEKSVLLTKATGNVQVTLTAEQAEEMEDLKFSDPEAWRKKMNAYEAAALTEHQKTIDEEVKKVSTSSLEEEERERRKVVLSEFLETHEGFDLNDDIIANDIPPRIVKKLETGKISFEDFLQECYDYSNTGKVIKQDEEVPGQPNLSKVGGGNRPDKNAVKEDIVTSYKKETY